MTTAVGAIDRCREPKAIESRGVCLVRETRPRRVDCLSVPLEVPNVGLSPGALAQGPPWTAGRRRGLSPESCPSPSSRRPHRRVYDDFATASCLANPARRPSTHGEGPAEARDKSWQAGQGSLGRRASQSLQLSFLGKLGCKLEHRPRQFQRTVSATRTPKPWKRQAQGCNTSRGLYRRHHLVSTHRTRRGTAHT
jgi:hypothetical protein